MSLDPLQADALGSTPAPTARVRRGALGRRQLVAAVLLLFAGGVVLCALVVRQRDQRVRLAALHKLDPARQWLNDYLAESSFLPPRLEKVEIERPAMQYPAPAEIMVLRNEAGPFALFAGPVAGMIMPGADGCAALVYEDGRVHTRWLTLQELRAARQHREALVQSGEGS